MDYLGTCFFILTPFALFCSEVVPGLILAPIFLILGFVCKWVAKNGNDFSSRTTAKHYVSPEEFWKIHFLRLYNSFKEKSCGNAVEDARRSADDIARAHGVVPPSDARFEQIARENGLKTKRVMEAERQNKNRIRIAERVYMNDLVDDYEKYAMFQPYIKILREMANEIPFRHPKTANYIWKYYNIDEIREIFKTIPEKEKEQAKRIVDEFDRQVVEFLETDCSVQKKMELRNFSRLLID